MFTVPLGDGFTTVTINGDNGGALDPSLPLVVLLHGMGHEPGTRSFRSFGKHVELVQNFVVEPDGD